MQIEKTVFISYRRTNIYTAIAVYQNLKANGYDVFLDFESIDSGAFSQVILNQIAARAHFIVILTPSALERCSQPGDWLRKEIEHALELKRNIVPLTFEGFNYKDVQKYLTGKLSQLLEYNALTVPAEYFDEAMNRLRSRFLNKSLEVILHPAVQDNAEVKRKLALTDRQPLPTSEQVTAESYFERGYNRKDYAGKIEAYTQAIRLNPAFARAYNNRGVIYATNSELLKAVQDYDRAIELEPAYAQAYFNRAFTKTDLNDYPAAVEDYSTAIALNPGYAEAYINRGELYFLLGNYGHAVDDFKEANALLPGDAMTIGGLAVAYHADNQTAKAFRVWNQLLAINPDCVDAEQAGKLFNWASELVEEARKLTAKL
jgi:tetratricopeptide (TPR) repeat protein